MKLGEKVRWIAVAAALVVIVGAGAQALAGSGKACPSAASKSGCAAATMGMCTGSASACTGMKAKGTSAEAQTGPVKAGPMFPEGTMVTAVEVPGGMDLLFTGKDLEKVQTVLKEHIVQCNNNKTCAGTTCNVTATTGGVMMAVRGADPSQCCVGLMATEAGASTGAGCPAGHDKGTTTKTSTTKSAAVTVKKS